MNIKTIAAIAAIFVVLGAGYAVAKPAGAGFWNNMMSGFGTGYGMMGNGGMMGGYGPGNGMMGNGGMMGDYGGGMMGNGRMMDGTGGCGGYETSAGYGENATPITIEKAKESVENYLASTGNDDLQLSEVMEFNNHFYAEVKEKSTGVHAFELLVNRYTGAVVSEMGPNMMWNTKYGHMTPGVQAKTSVTAEQAQDYAQKYLDKALPGTRVGEPEAFYGYYTLHVLKDGKIQGMLSVNSDTGAVWYHNWHGEFIKMLEVD